MKYRNMKSMFFVAIVFVVLLNPLLTQVYAKTTYNCSKGIHRYTVTVLNIPTETESGIRNYSCDLCKYSYNETIKMAGHQYGNWIEQIPSTCNSQGKQIRICQNNDEHKEESIVPVLGHNYGKWIIEKDSSLLSDGEKYRLCSRDSTHIEREAIPMIIANVTPTDIVITSTSFSLLTFFSVVIAGDISVLIWYKKILKKQRIKRRKG